MNFVRSHARSKSRSPAPNSSFSPSPATPNHRYSRPPNFLPPSHYAAAGGLTCTKNSEDCLPVFHPVDCLNEDAESKVGAVGRLMGRSPNGRASGKYSASPITDPEVVSGKERDQQARRKSQLGNIPLLETQLLPSLRDTVDRMTQSPQHKVVRCDRVDAQTMSNSHSASSRRRREDVVASSSTNSIHHPQPGHSRSTPDSHSSSGIPRLNAMNPPTPKSVLKSPARRSIFTPAMNSSRSPHPYQPWHAERIVASGSESGPEEHASRDRRGSTKNSTPSISRWMPTSVPKHKAETKSKSIPSTPQPPLRSTVFATPQPSRLSVSPLPHTSIPRPAASRYNHLPSSDSGSSLERRVGMRHSPGRLVVTNAVIVPSSSESDRGNKNRNRHSRWIAPNDPPALPPAPVNLRGPASPSSNSKDASTSRTDRSIAVGLGLNVKGVELGRREEKSPMVTDDESMYDDDLSDQSLLTDEPLVPLSEDDDDSLYEDAPPRAASRSSSQHYPNHDKRRQEALQGLVEGLHRDYGVASRRSTRSSMTRDDSDAGYSAQGLAISGSADLQDTRAASVRFSQHSLHSQSSPASQWEAESVYSDDDRSNAQVRDPPVRDDDQQTHRSTSKSRQRDCHSADTTDNTARSLRQSRVPWKRPRSSLGVRDSQYGDQSSRPPSSLLDPGDCRHSASSMSAPVSASPRSGSPMVSRSNSPLPQSRATSPPQNGPRLGTDDSYLPSCNSGSKRSKALSMSATKESSTKANARDSTAFSIRASRALSGNWDDQGKAEDPGARERLAFGIPESLSYGGNSLTPDDESIRPPFSRFESMMSNRPDLSRADSDLSVAESAWREQVRFSKELSKGAAALFETLTTKAIKNMGGRPPVYDDADYDDHEQDKTPVAEPSGWITRGTSTGSHSHSRSRSRSVSRSPAPLVQIDPVDGRARRRSLDTNSLSSLAPSPESVYDEPESPIRHTASPPPALQQPDLGPPGSWRSTLSPEVYRSLSNHYGLAEMDRQELIHELFTSEKAFVKSARHVICTYFVPLRARDSCTWLPGLPPDVARFFDWVEDIVNLHAAIARGLSTVVAIWKTGSIVLRVGGTLRAFVPQLEVYMPYLVKLESVRETLRWHVEKDGGELGEYLRMRDKESVQGEWALEQLLEQPAARLQQYLDMFQRLCELTQREHPDHLAAISLLYATRMAVRVMDEVKAREDEYDFVKELASRIDGLSETAPLARRARRLLWYGTLLQTGMPPREDAHTDASGLGKEPRFLAVSGIGLGRQPAQRMSQLVTAVRDWDARRSRGGSVSSYASSMASVQTTDTLSSASSSSILITPRSGQFFGISASARPGSASRNGVKANGAREVPGQKVDRGRTLNVMVFTDLIVFATPAQEEGDGDVRGESEREQRCHLLGGVGLSRILDVQEGADDIVSLDLVSISPEHLDTGFVGEDTSVVSITLALPAVDGDAGTRQELVAALRKCHRHTIRSLSFPSLPGTMMEDVEIDTRQSLVGILSSGLPLPKSPSIQFDEAAQGERRDAIDGEREERGWWTLRFQQVLRELQREEVVSGSSASETEKAR